VIRHDPEHRRLRRLADGVHWLPPSEPTDRPVLGVVSGPAGTLVVDAGNSAAHAAILLGQLAEHGLPAPTHVVLTHWHWDHVFGSAAYGEAVVVGHGETGRRLRDMAAWAWDDDALDARVEAGVEIAFCRDHIRLELPAPRRVSLREPGLVLTGELELDLGGGVVARCVHVGGDHAEDSVAVVVPAARVAFLADCLYPDLYAPEPRYTLAGVRGLVSRLRALDADRYLWGHDPEPMGRGRLVAVLDRLEEIGAAVEAAAGDVEAATASLGALSGDDRETIAAFAAGLAA
jgi:glyoxylase-like metal-dependent hydrolase (beta-lactamase superfamily II)